MTADKIQTILLFIFIYLRLTLVRFLRVLVITCPERFLRLLKPKAVVPIVKMFNFSDSSDSDSDSDNISTESDPIAKFNIENNVKPAAAGGVDILYAIIFGKGVETRVESKLSCLSVLEKITLNTLTLLGTGRYFFMLARDDNGYYHKVLIDLDKKIDLVNMIPIMFSRFEISVIPAS